MEPFDTEARVVKVVARPFPYYTIELEGPVEWTATRAGQFVMVGAHPVDRPALEPYLRRAFSIHQVSRTEQSTRIELLAKIVGPGTRSLAARQAGDRLPVLGPLGRPFTLPGRGRVALVAGGVGSAPLLLLARELRERAIEFDFFYGGRSEIDLARRDDFAALVAPGGEFVGTTEDGSFGRRGRITEPLVERLAEGRYRAIYACGPIGLLERLAALSVEHGVAGEAALETAMGCGFGACLGCAVPLVTGRYGLCCKDGPVFPFDAVTW